MFRFELLFIGIMALVVLSIIGISLALGVLIWDCIESIRDRRKKRKEEEQRAR